MRVLCISHQDDAGAGVFGEVATRERVDLVEWRPGGAPAPALERFGAAVVLGASFNVADIDRQPQLRDVLAALTVLIERRVPLLGVCLGAQLVAQVGGGSVRRCGRPEIGWCGVELDSAAAADPLLGPLPERFDALQWHSYEAVPPAAATVLARSADSLQAFRLADAPAWGIQFHAEVSATDLAHWTAHYARDPDAVALGVSPVAMRAATATRIDAWNELGRALFGRFLAVAGAAAPAPSATR